jgi:putative NADH-flavin reductase
MKLLILGATGGTGRHLLTQALEAGHEVTVLARNHTAVSTLHPRLRVVEGDLTAAPGPTEAIRGQDAVLSAIGRGQSFKSERLIQRSVPALLKAMEATGVRRLIFTSAIGVGDSAKDTPLAAKLFSRILLRDIYADKLIGDDMIRRSGLDWTIVQPTKLTDGPLTGTYRSGERLPLRGLPSISRADTARFLLTLLADRASIGKTLIVSN